MICEQPATFAGIASISTVENKGADPPGIYSPTFSMATDFRTHLTPGTVCIFTGSAFCAAWNIYILSYAAAMALFSSAETSCDAISISSGLTSIPCERSTESISSESAIRALSPSEHTREMMPATLSSMRASSVVARSVSFGHSDLSGSIYLFITTRFYQARVPECPLLRWP